MLLNLSQNFSDSLSDIDGDIILCSNTSEKNNGIEVFKIKRLGIFFIRIEINFKLSVFSKKNNENHRRYQETSIRIRF
jgi:hypothetical protein